LVEPREQFRQQLIAVGLELAGQVRQLIKREGMLLPLPPQLVVVDDLVLVLAEPHSVLRCADFLGQLVYARVRGQLGRRLATFRHLRLAGFASGTTTSAGGCTMRSISDASASKAWRFSFAYACRSSRHRTPVSTWPRHISAMSALMPARLSSVRLVRLKSWIV